MRSHIYRLDVIEGRSVNFREALSSIPMEDLKQLVVSNYTFTKVVKELGSNGHQRHIKALKERLIKEGIDYSHIVNKTNHKGGWYKIRQEGLSDRQTASLDRGNIRRFILNSGIIPYFCNLCGLLPSWEGKSLTLQLDHINGDRLDNRLENLRFLCPNCHSQTETFTGRNQRNWKPDKDELISHLEKFRSLKALSAEKRVNPKTIKEMCREYNIDISFYVKQAPINKHVLF